MERLRSIDVDVVHRLGSFTSTLQISDGSSYFWEKLLEWREFNCTTEFADFIHKVSPLASSFVLLAFNKDLVISHILACLRHKDSPALEPLLDLLTCFVRDLRSDSYPYFGDMIDTVATVLKYTNDSRIVEAAFQALGYIYKYLWKLLLRDFAQTVAVLKKLLGDRSENIRTFSSVGVAFLVRKSAAGDEVADVLKVLISAGVSNDIPPITVADILMEAVKGPSQGFHSKMPSIIHGLMSIDSDDCGVAEDIMSRLVSVMTIHGDSTSVASVLELLCQGDWGRPALTCRLLSIILIVRKGSRSPPDLSIVHSKLGILINCCSASAEDRLFALYIACFSTVAPATYNAARDLLKKFTVNLDFEQLQPLFRTLLATNWTLNDDLVVPEIIKALSVCVAYEDFSRVLACLIIYAETCGKPACDVSKLAPLIKHFQETITDSLANENRLPSLLALIDYVGKGQCDEGVVEFLTSCIKAAHSGTHNWHGHGVFPAAIKSCFNGGVLSVIAPTLDFNLGITMANLLQEHPDDVSLIESFGIVCSDVTIDIDATGLFPRAFKCLLPNIKHHDPIIRGATLQFLKVLHLRVSQSTAEDCPFDLCMEIDSVANEPSTSRHKFMLLSRLGRNISTSTLPFDHVVVFSFALSILAGNFTPLYPGAMDLAALILRDLDHDKLCWSIIIEDIRLLQITEDPKANLLPTEPSMRVEPNEKGKPVDVEIERLECLLRTSSLPSDTVFRRHVNRIPSSVRFDAENYLSLLFTLLAERVPEIASRSAGAVFHPMIIDLASVYVTRKNEAADSSSSSLKIRRNLLDLLRLFSKFIDLSSNLAKPQQDLLEKLLLHLLSKNDPKIQKVSLSCLRILRKSALAGGYVGLDELLDESTFKDRLIAVRGMAQDEMSVHSNAMSLEDKCLIRILFSKTLKTKSLDEAAIKTRRCAVASFLGSCSSQLMRYYVDLLILPFRRLFPDREDIQQMATDWDPVMSIRIIRGLLKNMHETFILLGSHLVPFYNEFLEILCTVFDIVKCNMQEDESQFDSRYIRSLGVKILAHLFESVTDNSLRVVDFERFMPRLMKSVLFDKISCFQNENVQSSSPLMEMFVCWSSRSDYYPFLVDYSTDLVPNVFCCINAVSVKPAVVTRVLDFASNLMELHDRSKPFPHASSLFSQIIVFLQSSASDRHLCSRISHIIADISLTLKSEDHLAELLRVFSEMLKRPDLSEQIQYNVLVVFCASFSLLPYAVKDEVISSTYSQLARLLSSSRENKTRIEIVKAFKLIAAHDSQFLQVSSIIADLNAYDVAILDSFDWERKGNAIASIVAGAKFAANEWLPIIHHFIYEITEGTEMSVRFQATSVIKVFVDCAVLDKEGEIYQMLIHIVYPSIKSGLRSKTEAVRVEYLRILEKMVQTSEVGDFFSVMKPLLGNAGDDSSFFENVHHIQSHRRMRAIRKFADSLPSCQMPSKMLSDVFLQLLYQFIFSEETASINDLIMESIACVGSIGKFLSWSHYYAQIKRITRMLQSHKSIESRIIRLLCSLLNGFRWNIDGLGDERDSGNFDHIKFTIVYERILPRLYAIVRNFEDGDANFKLRVPVALTFVNLIQKMNHKYIALELPKLLTSLCQALRSHSIDVRNAIRSTLVEISCQLGSLYFPFILKELATALTRGYQLHVLGYTVNFLLEKSQEARKSLNFADCRSRLSAILLEDIFGNVAEEKEVDQLTRKMPEVGKKKGFDSYRMIMTCISDEHIFDVLLPIRDRLITNAGVKFRRECQELFKQMSYGASVNTILTCDSIVSLAKKIIDRDCCLFQYKVESVKSISTHVEVQSFRRTDAQLARSDFFQENNVLLVEFGFALLNVLVKHEKLDAANAGIVALISEKFVNSSDLCLSIMAMKMLVRVWNSFPCNETTLSSVLGKCLELSSRLVSCKSEHAQCIIRLISVCIKHSATPLPEKEIVFLLNLIKPDLQNQQTQNNAFTLIKMLLRINKQIPEIYDLMDEISQLMLTSGSPAVRDTCRQCLFQFLIDYPIGEKKRQRFMNYFISNLDYKHASGRESVLEFLNSVVRKFPSAIIDEYAHLIFFGLAVQLQKDDNDVCREMISELLKCLSLCLSTSATASIVKSLNAFLGKSGSKFSLAVDTLGLLLESISEENLGKVISFEMLADMLKLLLHSISDSVEDGQENGEDWKALYQKLVFTTKIFSRMPRLSTEIPLDLLEKLIVYPHIWIRCVSIKLLTFVMEEKTIPVTKSVAFSVFSQLYMEEFSDDMVSVLVKCLYTMHSSLESSGGDDHGDGHWLISKLTGISRKLSPAHTSSRKVVFQALATFANLLSLAALKSESFCILMCLHRYLRDEGFHDDKHEELKKLCVGVDSLIRKKIGEEHYTECLVKVEAEIREIRQERREQRKLLAITNPVAHAKRKISQNITKKNSKKRKMEGFANSRIRYSVSKLRADVDTLATE